MLMFLVDFLLLAIPTFLVFGTVLLIRDGRRANWHRVCASCGYDLTGHAGLCVVCPECGRGSDGQSTVSEWQARNSRWRRTVGILMVIAGCVGVVGEMILMLVAFFVHMSF